MKLRNTIDRMALVFIACLTLPTTLLAVNLPAVSSGTLQLWLKADAGVTADASGLVSQWEDQSSNANNATQPDAALQPVLVPNTVPISQKPVLRFDGVQSATDGDYLQGAGQVDVPAGCTWFLFYRRSNPAPVREQIPFGIGVPTQTSANRFNYIRSAFGGGDDEMSFAAWANDHGTGFSVPADTYRIWVTRLSDAMDQVDLIDSDGDTDTPFTLTLGSLLPPQAGYYVAGLGSQTRNLNGDIAELIVYKGALSDADVAAVSNYLKGKYYHPESAPYVISSQPKGKTVAADVPITIQVQDSVNQLAPASVQLIVNGQSVTPVISKSGNVSTITYTPPAPWRPAPYAVQFIYSDNASSPLTQTNDFSFTVPGPSVTSTAPVGDGIETNATINIELTDVNTQVAASSIQLFLNGQAVTPTIDKPAGSPVTTVTYDPKGAVNAGALNTVRIIFGDTSTPPILTTNEFSFVVVSPLTASKIINIDINGARYGAGTEDIGATYVGLGAAPGGGKVFNGLTADSRLPDGSNDDGLTVAGSNLQNSLGQATSVGFSISTVGGFNNGVSPEATGASALFNDYIFVGNFGQTTSTADFTISGLGSIPVADVYFYHSVGPAQPITIPGASPGLFVNSGIFTTANTILFSHVPVSGGRITGTLAGANASLSGLTVMEPMPQPYILSVAPTGRGVKADSAITIQLFDYVTQVAPATIQLTLNGQVITPTINKPAGSQVTTLSYSPSGGWPSVSTNTVKIVFSDTSTPPIVQSTEFIFVSERITAQQSWSAAADFSIATNPNGAWSYGTMARVSPDDPTPNVSVLTLYENGTANDIGTPNWYWHTGGIDPNISYNPTTNSFVMYGVHWDAKKLSFGPGGGGTLTVMRWTAPKAGLYSINTSFLDNQSQPGDSQVGADVYVFQNDAQLFVGDTGTNVGAGVSYSTNLTLAAGDRMDLIVGAGSDLVPNGKNTRVDATIRFIPKAIGINFRADDASQTMDPTDVAGVFPTANWNNVPAATLSVANLIDASGASTPVSMAITTPAPAAYQGGNTAPTPGDQKMMTGHIYVGEGSKIDVQISGLDASYTGNFGYDVYVYYRSGAGAFKPQFTILDPSGATVAGPAVVMDSTSIGFDGNYVASDGAGSAGHYYQFTNLKLPTFTLETTPIPGGGYAYFSGMQIIQSSSAPPAKLSIAQQANNIVISWTGTGTLQSADKVDGPWTDIAGATSPRTETPSTAQKFYRLKK